MAADAGAFRGKRIDGGRVLRARRHQQQSFYRWRLRLGGVDQSLVANAAGARNTAGGFIDLGALAPGRSRMELRLDLGGGMQLHLLRG